MGLKVDDLVGAGANAQNAKKPGVFALKSGGVRNIDLPLTDLIRFFFKTSH